MRRIVLLDNGSLRPASTRAMRRIAAALTTHVGETIVPVSLRHADRIDAARLDGVTATTLEPLLRQEVTNGVRDFLLLPLFFGRSAALTRSVPEIITELRRTLGEFQVHLTDELYPLPTGEPHLVDILSDHIRQMMVECGGSIDQVILVDHGSPNPQITAVRTHIAGQLRDRFAGTCQIDEAVMERRAGPDYDFNGVLLEHALARIAQTASMRTTGLAMLFLAPGRHAGPGGDIAQICKAISASHPGLALAISPLVGEHPALIDILVTRLAQGGVAI